MNQNEEDEIPQPKLEDTESVRQDIRIDEELATTLLELENSQKIQLNAMKSLAKIRQDQADKILRKRGVYQKRGSGFSHKIAQRMTEQRREELRNKKVPVQIEDDEDNEDDTETRRLDTKQKQTRPFPPHSVDQLEKETSSFLLSPSVAVDTDLKTRTTRKKLKMLQDDDADVTSRKALGGGEHLQPLEIHVFQKQLKELNRLIQHKDQEHQQQQESQQNKIKNMELMLVQKDAQIHELSQLHSKASKGPDVAEALSTRLKGVTGKKKKNNQRLRASKHTKAIVSDEDDEEGNLGGHGAAAANSIICDQVEVHHNILSKLETYFEATALQGHCRHCRYNKEEIGESLRKRPLYTSRLPNTKHLKSLAHSLQVRASEINRALQAPADDDDAAGEEETVCAAALEKPQNPIPASDKSTNEATNKKSRISRQKEPKTISKSKQQNTKPPTTPAKPFVFTKPPSKELDRPSRRATRSQKGQLGFLSDPTSNDETTNRNNSSSSVKLTSPAHSTSQHHQAPLID